MDNENVRELISQASKPSDILNDNWEHHITGELQKLGSLTRSGSVFLVYGHTRQVKMNCHQRVFRQFACRTCARLVYKYVQNVASSAVKFSDSYYTGGNNDWKSRYCIEFNVTSWTVPWNLKRHSDLTKPPAEAEYLALCSAAQDCTWVPVLFFFAARKSVGSPKPFYSIRVELKFT